MFPYFELFKNATNDPSLSLGAIMIKHWIFFFMLLPLQFGISAYLTYFETKKLIVTKDKFQLLIIAYNASQLILPIVDLFNYID